MHERVEVMREIYKSRHDSVEVMQDLVDVMQAFCYDAGKTAAMFKMLPLIKGEL